MTKTLWTAGVILALCAAQAVAAAPQAATACGMAAPSSAYPTFCAIPPTPTDLRSAAAFRAAVVETRLAGRRLVRQDGPDSFGLPVGGAADFAGAARSAAAASAPLAGPTETETQAFAADAKRRVIPPHKTRR